MMSSVWHFASWNLMAATVLAAVVWLLAGTPLLRNRPALEHILWGLVLLKLIAPPTVFLPVLPPEEIQRTTSIRDDNSFPSPASDDPRHFDSESSAEQSTADAIQPAGGPQGSRPASANQETPFVDDSPIMAEREPSEEDSQSQVAQANTWTTSSAGSSGETLLVVVVWFHCIVGLAIVARAFYSMSSFARVIRSQGSNADERMVQLTAEAAEKMGISQVPTVLAMKGVFPPLLFLCPFARCSILLPSNVCQSLSDEEFRHILAHELAHLKRKDPLTNGLSLLIAACFWWFPIAWLARHRMRLAAEASCDALALEKMGGSRKTYAQVLLTVVDFTSRNAHPLPAAISSFGNSRTLRRRIEMIGNPNVDANVSRLAWVAIAAILLALNFVPVQAQSEERPLATSQTDQKNETETADERNPLLGSAAIRVKPLLANGKPAHKVYLTLWRALENREAPSKNRLDSKGLGLYDTVVWADQANRAQWVRERSAHPNDGRHGWEEAAFEFANLPAGRYRVTAVTYDPDAELPDPTPYGVSDPVTLGPEDQTREISFRLQGTAALSIRFVDGESRKPIESLAVRLRNDSGMPIVHGHGSGNYFERTNDQGKVAYDFLLPGNYTMQVLGKNPGVNEFVQYDPVKTWIPVQVTEAPTEIEVPVTGRKLSPQEIQKRFPFSVYGKVTDPQGKPLENVVVRAATGMGTLIGGGRTLTDKNGEYRLYFGPGISLALREDSPLGVGIQAALISANREGYYETSQNQQGNLLMSDQPQKSLEALLQKEGEIWDRTSLEQIVLPDLPREVNFTLDRAAVIEGKLQSQANDEIADQQLYLTGQELPPGQSVLAGSVMDRKGTFRFDSVPLKKAWRFEMRVPGTRVDLQSEEFTLTQPGSHACTVTLKTEPSGDGAVKLTLIHDFKKEGSPANSALKGSVINKASQDVGKTTLEIEVLEAEQNLVNANKRFQYSERLEAKGYITRSQATMDKLAVEKAKLELELAKGKLQKLNQQH